MKTREPGMPNPGMAIFVLFFGMSLLEALGRRAWSVAAFWLGCGVAFYLIGNGFRRQTRTGQR